MAHGMFRPRRLREKPLLRKLVRETALAVDDFLYPLFVVHGRGVREPIAPMPGQHRFSIDELVKECKDAAGMGIPGVLLFGIPSEKDPRGSEAYAEDGIVQQAVRAVKNTVPDLLVITDVCLCEYTSHGHCGVVEDGTVKNDPTLELLARTAVSHVEAGADMVAPSDMMDGRVGAIREALDEASFAETPIMAYSAKYASCFFEPFRAAAESTPQFGDRRAYQMDPANAQEAMREIALDLDEGADIVMVKPALPYLDVIARAKLEFGVPLAAYSVSGEYAIKAMLDLALQRERGLIPIQEIADRQKIPQRYLEQVLLSLKRAGLLTSKRGSTGGYHLTRDPEEITVGAVLRAVEGTRSTFQASESPDLADLWLEVSEAVSKVVDRVTFGELVGRARERRGRARPMYHI